MNIFPLNFFLYCFVLRRFERLLSFYRFLHTSESHFACRQRKWTKNSLRSIAIVAAHLRRRKPLESRVSPAAPPAARGKMRRLRKCVAVLSSSLWEGYVRLRFTCARIGAPASYVSGEIESDREVLAENNDRCWVMIFNEWLIFLLYGFMILINTEAYILINFALFFFFFRKRLHFFGC